MVAATPAIDHPSTAHEVCPTAVHGGIQRSLPTIAISNKSRTKMAPEKTRIANFMPFAAFFAESIDCCFIYYLALLNTRTCYELIAVAIFRLLDANQIAPCGCKFWNYVSGKTSKQLNRP
jgi:hypothetical protein